MRLFIALELKEEVRKKIFKDLEPLRRKNQSIHWVNQEHYHLTLKFLGEVEEDKIKKIEEIINDQVNDLKILPFEIILAGVGGFPNLERPKVIWLDVPCGREKIVILAKKIDEGLLKEDFEKEKQEFKPHLTIARIKDLKAVQSDFLTDCQKYEKTLFGSEISSMISLLQSTLTPYGPIYKRIYHKNFSG